METPPLPTNPETPLTPPSSCCSPKSKLLCLSVGLVVLAIVATASFLLGKYSLQNKAPAPTAEVTPRPTLFPTPTENPTANWKTYTNKVYKFQFKYPESFLLKDALPDHQLDRALSPSEKIELTNEKDRLTLSIYIDQAGFGPIFADKTLKVAYKLESGIYIVDSKENDISKYLETNKPTGYIIDTTPFIPTENFGLFFVYNYLRAEPDRENLFPQILSTFKFFPDTNLESNSDKLILTQYLKAKFAQEMISPTKPEDIIVNIQKLEDNFATGTFGLVKLNSGGGGIWIAKKNNGSWVQIWGGQESPVCSDIEKYKVPASIITCN